MRAVDRRLEQRHDQSERRPAPVAPYSTRRSCSSAGFDVHEEQTISSAPAARNTPWRDEEVVRPVAEALRGDHRRGAVDHDQAEHDDEHRGAEEPGVEGEFAAHTFTPSLRSGSARTSSSKCSPRCSKLRYWSKLAQAGESSTVSPGFAFARAHSIGVLHVARGDDLGRAVQRLGDAIGGVADGQHGARFRLRRGRASARTRRPCPCRRG